MRKPSLSHRELVGHWKRHNRKIHKVKRRYDFEGFSQEISWSVISAILHECDITFTVTLSIMSTCKSKEKVTKIYQLQLTKNEMRRYKRGKNIHIKVWRHTFHAFESGDLADLSISYNNPISIQRPKMITKHVTKAKPAQYLINFLSYLI